MGSKRVFVCPNGVDTKRLRPSPKFDTFSVLFLGRIEPEKGVDLLPRIWAGLRARLSDYDIYIAGSGTMAPSLRALATEQGVHVLGWVSKADKDRLVSRCHVMVTPSRYEAFYITGMEALASGTPMVCFDVGGVRDYEEPGVNGYIVTSVEDMVGKVQSIHEDWLRGPTYERLCQHARSALVEYDWGLIAPRIGRMFTQVRDDWESLHSRR